MIIEQSAISDANMSHRLQ